MKQQSSQAVCPLPADLHNQEWTIATQLRGRQKVESAIFAPLRHSVLRNWYVPDLQFCRNQKPTIAAAEDR